MTGTITRFETNRIYMKRSTCDYNCVFAFRVIKRTAKRITIEDAHGKIVTKGVSIYNGAESCYPNGNYSMAVVINAV